jgi:hypothetical protein
MNFEEPVTTGLSLGPHPFRLVISSSHEFVLEAPSRRSLITNGTLVINEGIKIMGLRVRGAPATPLLDEVLGVVSDKDHARFYSQIPADADAGITRDCYTPAALVVQTAPSSPYPFWQVDLS